MIEVRDINIFFRKTIIKESTIKLNPSTITLFTGKSGSGKTCILNVIGLLDDTNTYTFLYNNKIIDKNVYSTFRKKYISYVYQEHNMLDEVSVYDNFKLQYSLIGKKVNKDEVRNILQTVLLDVEILGAKVKNLSGGQKQRIAIALALVKQPRLLLLDEPTASLDDENTKQVIKVLDSIKESGVTIVVATHNPTIYNSDVIYNVEDRYVVSEDIIDNIEHTNIDGIVTNKSKLLTYPLIQLRNHKILYVTVFLMFTLITTMYLQIQLGNVDYNLALDEILSAVETDEIAISYQNAVYYEAVLQSNSLHIDDNLQSYISDIDGVVDVFPYYESSAISLVIDENRALYFEEEQQFNTIEYEGTSINTIDFTHQNINIGSVKSEYQIPRCKVIDNNVTNGVFISSDVASNLGIDKLDNTKISFYMPIYLGYYDGYQEATLDDSQNLIPGYDINTDLVIYEKMEYPVKGIYEDIGSINQFYSYSYSPNILVDYQEFERLHNEALVDNEIPNIYDNTIYSLFNTEIDVVPVIRNGLLVIKVEESAMEDVYTKLLELEPKLNVKNKINMESNLVARRDLLTITSNVVEIIIMLISVILVLITYSYVLAKRKKELSYVAAQGVKKAFLLPVIDIVYMLLAILPICIIQASTYHGLYATIPISTLLSNALVQYLQLFLLYVVFITIFTYLYYRKVSIASELRSK